MKGVVRISYPTRNNIEKVKTIIKLYAVLKHSRISDLQTELLAYLIIYGINDDTKDFIINKLQLCTTVNSYKKAMTTLKREGMLRRDADNTRYEIAPDIVIDPKDDTRLIIWIKKPKLEQQ